MAVTPEHPIDRPQIVPRWRYGYLVPTDGRMLDLHLYQLYRLLPSDAVVLARPLGIREYTKDQVEALLPRADEAVDNLRRERVDRLVLGGVPVSAQLGRSRTLAWTSAASERVGVPCDAPLEAVIAAMEHLGLTRVAIGSRWASELNSAVVDYLREGDIDVVAVTERGQWAKAALAMSMDEGLEAALQVGREAARIDPRAEAIFLPGGAALTLHAVPILEEEFGVPVLTNHNAEVWLGLIHTDVAPPMQGYGRLLASA